MPTKEPDVIRITGVQAAGLKQRFVDLVKTKLGGTASEHGRNAIREYVQKHETNQSASLIKHI